MRTENIEDGWKTFLCVCVWGGGGYRTLLPSYSFIQNSMASFISDRVPTVSFHEETGTNDSTFRQESCCQRDKQD